MNEAVIKNLEEIKNLINGEVQNASIFITELGKIEVIRNEFKKNNTGKVDSDDEARRIQYVMFLNLLIIGKWIERSKPDDLPGISEALEEAFEFIASWRFRIKQKLIDEALDKHFELEENLRNKMGSSRGR